MKASEVRVSHWARTMWNEGPKDGVIVGKDNDLKRADIYFLHTGEVTTVDYYQILDIGNRLDMLQSGLPGMQEILEHCGT